VGLARRLDEAAQPKLDIERAPDAVRVAPAPGARVALDCCGVVDPALARARIKEHARDEIA